VLSLSYRRCDFEDRRKEKHLSLFSTGVVKVTKGLKMYVNLILLL
jgi:hypothetical protein